MVSPRDKLEKIPKAMQIWLILIPVFISAVLIFFLVLHPKAGKVERIKADVSRIQRDIIKERQLLASFEPLSDDERASITATKRTISSLMNRLGTAQDVNNRLTQRARNCNITDISIDPTYNPIPAQTEEQEAEEQDTGEQTEEEETPEFTDMETPLGIAGYRSFVKLTFHSDFESLGCFLRDIEKRGDTLIASLTTTRELPFPKTELILKVFAKRSR